MILFIHFRALDCETDNAAEDPYYELNINGKKLAEVENLNGE